GPADASIPSNQGPAVAVPAAAVPASDDLQTLRAASEFAGGPVQQHASGEVAPFGSPAVASPQPAQGWSSGAAYSAQPASGQGWSSGAYPPTASSGTEFPAGVYPTPGAAYNSGTYPPATPVPGMQASGVYPGQQSQPGWPGYPGQVPPPVAKELSGLIKPLPLWAFIVSILIVALLLAVLVFFTSSDWSAGAQTAGIVALVIGGLILIAFGMRAALGMLMPTNVHRRSQIISAILLA